MTRMRLMTGYFLVSAKRSISLRMPSMRKRTRIPSSMGSRWMSEDRERAASSMMNCTILTMRSGSSAAGLRLMPRKLLSGAALKLTISLKRACMSPTGAARGGSALGASPGTGAGNGVLAGAPGSPAPAGPAAPGAAPGAAAAARAASWAAASCFSSSARRRSVFLSLSSVRRVLRRSSLTALSATRAPAAVASWASRWACRTSISSLTMRSWEALICCSRSWAFICSREASLPRSWASTAAVLKAVCIFENSAATRAWTSASTCRTRARNCSSRASSFLRS